MVKALAFLMACPMAYSKTEARQEWLNSDILCLIFYSFVSQYFGFYPRWDKFDPYDVVANSLKKFKLIWIKYRDISVYISTKNISFKNDILTS